MSHTDSSWSGTCCVLLSVIIIIVLWMPPLWEELSRINGNLTRIVHFFLMRPRVISAREAFVAVAGQVSWLPMLVVRSVFGDVGRTATELITESFFILQMSVIPLSWSLARRRRQYYSATLLSLTALSAVTAIWSVMHIGEHIWNWLLPWTSAIGFVGLVGIVGVIAEELLNPNPPVPSQRAGRHFRSACTALVVVLAMVNTSRFVRQASRFTIHSPKIECLSKTVVSHFRHREGERPVVLFRWDHWPDQTAIILQLHKAGIPFAISEYWPALFGREYAHSESDREYLVLEYHDLEPRPGWEHIAACHGVHVYIVSKEAMNPTRSTHLTRTRSEAWPKQ